MHGSLASYSARQETSLSSELPTGSNFFYGTFEHSVDLNRKKTFSRYFFRIVNITEDFPNFFLLNSVYLREIDNSVTYQALLSLQLAG